MQSSCLRLLLLTPGSRVDGLSSLFSAVRQLTAQYLTQWVIAWECSVLDSPPVFFADGGLFIDYISGVNFSALELPIEYKISQVRELLRVEALRRRADVVLWLDDDMQPTFSQINHIVKKAYAHQVVLAPKMHSRHSSDDRICAWRLQEGKYVFMRSFVEPSYRYQGVDGLGFACTAHPAGALNDYSFPPFGAADDFYASACLRNSGWSMVVDYETAVKHKGAILDV